MSLQSSVFVVHFSNAFWNGNKAFPKGSSWNKIASLLVIFHLPYSKHRGVKICFHLCRYQNQIFSLVSHSCRSCSTLWHSSRWCRTSVVLVSLMPRSCLTCVARVTFVSHFFRSCCHSCCKLDKIFLNCILLENKNRESAAFFLYRKREW